MRTIDPTSARIFQIAFDVAEALNISLKEKPPKNSHYRLAYLQLFLFAKSFKTLQAISVLWGHGFPEDTNTLLRTMFELMLQSAYIKRAPKKSLRLFYGYWDYFLYERYKKSKKLKLGNAKSYVEMFGGTLSQFKKEYERLRPIYKNGQDWYAVGIGVLAKRVGRTHRHGTSFEYLSKYVHSAQMTINSYVDLGPNQISYKTSPKVSDDYLPVLETVRLFLEICEVMDEQLTLGQDSLISRGLLEIEQREKTYANTIGAAKEAQMTSA